MPLVISEDCSSLTLKLRKHFVRYDAKHFATNLTGTRTDTPVHPSTRLFLMHFIDHRTKVSSTVRNFTEIIRTRPGKEKTGLVFKAAEAEAETASSLFMRQFYTVAFSSQKQSHASRTTRSYSFPFFFTRGSVLLVASRKQRDGAN